MSYRCNYCDGQCTLSIRDTGHVPTSCSFGMDECEWIMLLEEEK